MEFEPIVSPIWMYGIAIFAILAFLVFQIKRSDYSPRRKWIKGCLNSLFLLTLLLFMANPVWEIDRNSGPILITSENVEKEELEFWKDSLGIQKVISVRNFKSNSDSIILLGELFQKEFLYGLRAKSVDWVVPASGDNLDFLDFKGILHQGESQRILGRMSISADSKLSVIQSGTELGAQVLEQDQTIFQLDVPASVLGRNEWEIRLNEELVGMIRFFVLPKKPSRVQLQVGFPNPEIRSLSRYLIGKGNKVQEEISLSKNTALTTEKQSLDSVDIFIIDPSQVQDSKLKKQVARGASILLINVKDPEKELNAFNKAFGAGFRVAPKGGIETIILDNGLEAMPFEWEDNETQLLMVENTVSIQQVGNTKIGVSLLKSSFPLAQSGDSLAYDKIWIQIIGELQPEQKANWKVKTPVYKNQFFTIEFNGEDSLISDAEETAWNQSLINPNSQERKWLSKEAGWQEIAKGVEVYVSNFLDFPMVFVQQERAEFLKSEVWLSSNLESQFIKNSIPYYVWGLIFIILLVALWLEPKVSS